MKRSVIAVLFSILAGCAAPNHGARLESGVNIQRADSPAAWVGYTYVKREEDGIHLQGALRNRFSGRRPIPGHLDIDLLSPDGELLQHLQAEYHRHNPHSSSAHFSVHIEHSPAPGSVLRVSHHTEGHG